MIHVVLPLAFTALLPFLLTLAVKWRRLSRRANHETRTWQAQLTGWRQRAHWAHQNAFETFPVFASAVILAWIREPGSAVAMVAAWAFLALRIAYSACYVADLASARTVVFLLSLADLLVLFAVALGL